jgi:H+/Cl- antiporter ClcA
VNHGSDYLWNDLFDTDTARWAVVPVAIGLSVGFSLVLRTARQRRVVPAETDPLAGAVRGEASSAGVIGVILLVGAASLLAGASLGPEAPLVGATAGAGAWAGAKLGGPSARKLLTLSSVGALLVVFFGSLVPLAIPVLLLYREEKKLVPAQLVPPVMAGLAAFGTLYLVKGKEEGYGSIPTSTHFEAHDFAAALVLGIVAVLVAIALKRLVPLLTTLGERTEARLPWPVSAALFGAVLGGLYLLGGESVQFSGSAGSRILFSEHAHDGALALAGIVAVKLVATAWSLGSGYRGGPIFPAVFIGVGMSLILGAIAADLGGPGATIGSVAGILTAMTSPVVAGVMLLALLPAELIGIALVGALGAVIGSKAAARLMPAS